MHPNGLVINEYVDDALDRGERAEIERHLAVCAECRALVDAGTGMEADRARAGRGTERGASAQRRWDVALPTLVVAGGCRSARAQHDRRPALLPGGGAPDRRPDACSERRRLGAVGPEQPNAGRAALPSGDRRPRANQKC
ncbi:MAG: hypothetical protein DMF91_19740 [Acidobacteria bacterium]|nr:MAG: hypothetical protein DMF91_19740 [Acidobacteriota bacterium]